MNRDGMSGRVPSKAYITLPDGERVPCLLEQLGPKEWQAVPVRRVELTGTVEVYVDVIPSGASIRLVFEEET